MHRLVIESSTSQASIALLADDTLLVEEIFPGGRGPVSHFFSILEKIVSTVEAIDEIIVGVGPGSYSGIRIGISAVIGLRLARKLPAWGVVSALGYEGEDYQVVLDARGSWTYSKVCGGQLVVEPRNCTREELLENIDSNLILYSPDQVADLPVRQAFPLASVLGKRRHVIQQPLQPLYLKKPHITVSKKAPLF